MRLADFTAKVLANGIRAWNLYLADPAVLARLDGYGVLPVRGHGHLIGSLGYA